MRDLFRSEKRVITNIGYLGWGVRLDAKGPVVSETYDVQSVKRHYFNSDFTLHINDEDYGSYHFASRAAAILPNALGAEVFLTIDKESGTPLILELMGGQAFPPKYFREYLQQIESAVMRAAAESGFLQRQPEFSSRDIVNSVRPQAVKYSRVLVVGNDICFLFCPQDVTPTARGDRCELTCTDHREIICYVQGLQISCIDGWIGTKVKLTDYKLVALPK